ncbi:hypothetical protein OA328_00035 [Paracoccaceae bacterium]|nr:hypothetical protein [Paracoccaceae bacterium]
MRTLKTITALLSLILSSTIAFSQSTINAGISYGSFNYDISGTKYTGDGAVVNLDGQMSSSLNYSLSISDGKFDDVVYNNSEGSVTYMVLPNIGVDFIGSQIKLGTVQETDTSLGFSYNLYASSLGIKVFVASDINNYGKFYTYGTKVNLGVTQGSRLTLSYKTEDRKQKATTMDTRFVYDLTSNLGLNFGYKSTETKNAAGTSVVLKGNTTYAGIVYKF